MYDPNDYNLVSVNHFPGVIWTSATARPASFELPSQDSSVSNQDPKYSAPIATAQYLMGSFGSPRTHSLYNPLKEARLFPTPGYMD